MLNNQLINSDAAQAIATIADKDGNYLRQAWEYILNCVSRFERLRQSGDRVTSPDASLFALSQNEQYSSIAVIVRRGSYSDIHATTGTKSILEQIEPSRMNQIFTANTQQNLNNEAVVDFVRALCKVSMEELRSPDPRVFCLTKIVEIA